MIKVFLKCSEMISQQIKENLYDVPYVEFVNVDKMHETSIVIAEINVANDVREIMKFKQEYDQEIGCIVSNQTYMFDLLDINPILFVKILVVKMICYKFVI